MNNLTQEQVSQLPDVTLNKMIGDALGFHTKPTFSGNWRWLDYCNNWSDLMPVLKENHKDFILMGYKIDQGLQCKRPRRTLAEWLFLVLQEKANNE